MKKLLYLVAVATLGFMSCQQEQDPVNVVEKNEPVTFKASIENLATRATYDSGDLLWTSGDQIGVYFPSWDNNKNESFHLSSGAGTTEGTFSRDNSDPFDPTKATVAFFPWQGTAYGDNNVWGENMYFKLLDSYPNYTSGKMLTPLVASISSSENIYFYHAGAAVKVTINNLPVGAKTIDMTVDGQQITGSYYINYANAGDEAMALTGSADNTKNKVRLIIAPPLQESEFTFIFPVPPLTTPKLTFEIKDLNDYTVWSKTTSKNQSSIGRANVLAMPATTITASDPYAGLPNSEWSLRGTFNDWKQDPMLAKDDDTSIARKVSFAAGDQFKVAKGGTDGWETSYPGSNYLVNVAGTYDVVFHHSTHDIEIHQYDR